MGSLVRSTVFFVSVLSAASLLAAQNAGNNQTPQPGYTLQAHAREVITDVTVTDRKGDPVHGLNESAFHIFDNGKPQHLASFREHTAQDPQTPIPETAPNLYSNAVLLHPPRVFNIIMLDTITINPVDQMYLRQQLDHFVQTLPSDEPFAIFARNNENTVMLANFTTDHQTLLNAVHRELPRMLSSGFRYYSTDISLMEELCVYLEQYPGRKNVLWFNGGSALALQPDPTTLPESVDLRPLYDALEKARVALYPIDARGLVVNEPLSMPLQQILMEEEADATGGHAVYNNNGLAAAAERIANSDSSFYTLTYSPPEVKLDNKWHKVKVEVEGSQYQLSYRRGYYDDGSNLEQPDNSEGRKRLVENGDTAPDLHTEPIIFHVSIAQADPAAIKPQPNMLYASTSPLRSGERSYVLHYSVPLDAFPVQTADARDKVSIGLALLAYNQYGRSVARVMQKITLGFPQGRVTASGPSPSLGFDQEINLPKGQDFLYVGVWNTQTGRIGTLQIPFNVAK